MLPDWQAELYDWAKNSLGIEIPRDRYRDVVVPRFEQIAEQHCRGDAAECVRTVLSQPDGQVARAVVDLATIGETYFFRHPEQLEELTAIATVIYHEVGRPLYVWCGACATGEEPASIAILLAEAGVEARISASDVNPVSLRRASQGGPYHRYAMRYVSDARRQRFFVRQGRDYWLKPEVVTKIRHFEFNLMSEKLPAPRGGALGWDMVICRNVFIYFSIPIVESIVTKMLDSLTAIGSLWVSAADPMVQLSIPIERVALRDSACYRRAAVGSQLPVQPALSRAASKAAGDNVFWTPTWIDDLHRAVSGEENVGAEVGPESHYALACALIDEDKLSLAREHLTEYLRFHPRDGLAQLALGNILAASHDFNAARTAYIAASVELPDVAEVHYLSGVTWLKEGRAELAAACFEKALSVDADFWPAIFHLASAANKSRDILRAELLYKQCLSGIDKDIRDGEGAEVGASNLFLSCANVVDSVHRELSMARGFVHSQVQDNDGDGEQPLLLG